MPTIYCTYFTYCTYIYTCIYIHVYILYIHMYMEYVFIVSILSCKFAKLSPEEQKVSELIGVKESVLSRNATGTGKKLVSILVAFQDLHVIVSDYLLC